MLCNCYSKHCVLCFPEVVFQTGPLPACLQVRSSAFFCLGERHPAATTQAVMATNMSSFSIMLWLKTIDISTQRFKIIVAWLQTRVKLHIVVVLLLASLSSRFHCRRLFIPLLFLHFSLTRSLSTVSNSLYVPLIFPVLLPLFPWFLMQSSHRNFGLPLSPVPFTSWATALFACFPSRILST